MSSGHSDYITKLAFNSDDTKMISVANGDKTVIVWSVIYDK